MIAPAPPVLTYGTCVVTAEKHTYGDERVGSVITRHYNELSRPSKIVYDIEPDIADGVVDFRTEISYRGLWQPLISLTYEGSSSAKLIRSIEYAYDSENFLVERRYDDDGDRQPEHIDRLAYDAAGRLIREELDLRTNIYTYDAEGRPASKYVDVLNDGVLDYGTRYIWEGDLIVALEDDDDADGIGERQWPLRYDEQGRLTYAENVVGEWDIRYNDNGWVTEIVLSKMGQWEHTTTYQYDSAGRLTMETYRDHTGDSEYTVYENRCDT
jgi:YD repeat-containing protein